jgi:hypothetical protein
MKRTGRRVALIFALAATVNWAPRPVSAGQDGSRVAVPMVIDVEGPRPLDSAISGLVKRHGWAITYEEMPLEYSEDTVDVARNVRLDGNANKPTFVPKGGRLLFAYEARPSGEDPEAVLLDLLRKYRASDPALDFRLDRTGDVFHLIPRAVRNGQGARESCIPLLDTKISIPNAERTVDEMVLEIVAAVRANGGELLHPPGWSSNLFRQTRVVLGADNETARSVLLRTLQTTKRPVTWAVLCTGTAASSTSYCALNLRIGEAADR